MDENTEIIDQFLSVLGKKSSEKPLASYTASVYQNPRPQKRETTFTAKDVISEVSKQIRAIQNADRVVSTKKASIALNKYGQSTFLPVNILSRMNATGQNPSSSKFDMETQFATDTQLVNIAQDAEALAGTATGVTQEFETTFCQNIDDDEEDLDNQTNIQNLDFPMLDISLKAPNPNITLHTLNPSNNHPKSEKNDEKSDQEEDIVFAPNVSSLEYLLVQQTAVKNENVIATDSCDDARGNEETDNNNTFTAKEIDRNTPQPKDHQALIEELKLDFEVPRPSSPVLNTEGVKSAAEKSDAPPNLVFDLDMFEKFEKIASKIVGNLHVDTAKETGHSQMIKTEVYDSEEAQFQSYYQTNTDQQTEYSAFKSILERETDFTNEDKVLKASNDILLAHGDSHKKLVCTGQSTVAEDIVQERDKCVKRVQSPNHNVISTDNESQFYPSTCEDKADIKTENLSRISDEIIFSSDEDEVNYIHKSIQDLPLTCALETSFYNDQSKVLDKTMNIAFQTASNKSMQVLFDSYGKGKHLLDDFVENKKAPTLNQLVDICSSNKTSFEGPKAFSPSSSAQNIFDEVKINFEDNLEKIKEKITDTIASDLEFVTCEDFQVPTAEILQNVNISDDVDLSREVDEPIVSKTEDEKTEACNVSSLKSMGTFDDNTIGVKANTYEPSADDNHKTLKDTNEEKLAESQQLFDEVDDDEDHLAPLIKNEERDVASSQILSFPKRRDSCARDIKIKRLPEDESNAMGDSRTINVKEAKDLSVCSSHVVKTEPLHCVEPNMNQMPIEPEELPSQIISLKNPDRPKKRKQEWSETSSNKRNKCFQGILHEENFEDIQFDTCDFDEITKEDSGYIFIRKETDDVDSKSNDPDKIHLVDAANQYSDDTHAKDTNSQVYHNAPLIGFKTASNKVIKVSNEAIAKTKKIFQDIVTNEEMLENDSGENVTATKQKGESNTDEVATDSKPASDITVHTAKRIISDIRNTTSNTQNSDSNSENSKEPLFYGFLHSEQDKTQVLEQIAKCKQLLENLEFDQSNFEVNGLGNVTSSNERVELNNVVSKSNENTGVDDETESRFFLGVSGGFDNSNPSSLQGFRPTSNDQVNLLCEEPMPLIDRYFEDIDEFWKKSTTNTRGSKFPMIQGFQTASKKPIPISAKATARSKKIFENIDKTDGDFDLKKQSEAVGYSVKRKSTFVQFQTASKKPLQISPKARTQKIFENIDLIGEQLTPESFPGKKEPFPDFQGFRTASNNPVNISTEALAKSEKIFQDIELKSQTGTTSSKTTVTKTFQGFQTASNKPVNVSEEALAKSRKIFQNIDEIDVTGAVRAEPVIRKAHSATFQGFQTASNKPVNISEEALAKGRTIFQDIDSNQQISNISQRDTSVTSFQGFQTASNKPVNISTEALAKSEKIFHDIEPKSQTGGTSSKRTVTKTFQGFQTASNKPVSVSEEALAKSKTIFQDFGLKTDTSDSSTKNSSARKTFPGFMTATNKPVIISEQAMAKSKKVFEEIEFCGQFSDNPAQKELEFGFKTANNNKISVSEEALTKSRRLLADIDREMIEESENDDTKATSSNIDTDPIINTQVLQNFADTLHTEDFFKDVSSRTVPNQEMTPKTCKRSGSPILSLPKAKKRRKFEIPYSQKVVQHKDSITKEEVEVKTEKPICEIQFDENYKKNKTYTLKDLKTLEANNPSEEHTTDPYISNFDYDTLLDFEFFDKRNDLDQTRLTMQDLIKKFEDSVNTKLIPQGWVENHLKLILWKLISYEIKFPKALQHICTARNVMNQLKYRYEKELFNAERPALRKILEKDDVASKTLVLCVVAISGDANDNATSAAPQELVLTDGWYCIKASADKMLSQLIRAGNIRVGTKLVTNGAELVGCEQGVSPWEDTSAIRLKLSGNSTRRARWDARLGYHGNAAILSRLTAVRPDGGKVAKLRAFVSRVYPALYVEKFEDGSTVTRSERLELMHQSQHESERMALMEKLYEDVEKEFSDQDSPDSEPSERPCESGSQIARAMKQCRDPQEFKCHLTTTQQDLLDDHETRKQERYLQNVQKRIREKMAQLGLDAARNVVPLLKVRIAGVEDVGGRVEVTKAMLSVWKPSDAVRDIVKEGFWIEVLNVVPTAVRYSELHLSAGRQSIFSQSKQKAPEKLKPYTETLKRTCYPIDHVNKPTEYNEIDTVGFICQIDPEIDKFDPNRDQFQNVYLADAEKNMICINFWGGLKKFGFETVLAAKQIVYCTNLQKRAGNTKKSIPQYRATEFTYFTKTPRNEVARRMIEEMGSKLAGIDKARFCQDCVDLKNKFLAVRLPSNAEKISPYRFQNIDLNLPKNNIFVDSPLAQRPKTDENLNLTGLDFESSFKEADSEKLSPKTLLRKRQVKEKLQKLKMYGEPPPLSPFTILNKSKNAGSAYKSPLIPKSDQNSRPLVTSPSGLSASVASATEIVPNRGKTDNLESSPVKGMNRTYVKRINVNPVKLNFSNNNIGNEDSMSESVDHFADDFDGSPPLSLD